MIGSANEIALQIMIIDTDVLVINDSYSYCGATCWRSNDKQRPIRDD